MTVLDAEGPGPEIGIIVVDLDVMAHFYQDTLGLRRVAERSYPSGTTIVVFQCGPTRIKLNRPTPPPAQVAAAGAHRIASGLRYLTFHVADAARAHAELAALGVELDGPVRHSPAGELFFARDPEGNNIEIVRPKD